MLLCPTIDFVASEGVVSDSNNTFIYNAVLCVGWRIRILSLLMSLHSDVSSDEGCMDKFSYSLRMAIILNTLKSYTNLVPRGSTAEAVARGVVLGLQKV